MNQAVKKRYVPDLSAHVQVACCESHHLTFIRHTFDHNTFNHHRMRQQWQPPLAAALAEQASG